MERALAILSSFEHERPSLGISEIARRVGLSKGIVFRAVQTMVDAGFLERADEDGSYRIGVRAFEVGSVYAAAATLERAAQEPMRDLASRHGYNVYLGVRDGRDMVYLATVEGSGPIKIHAAVGSRLLLHASAMGKVVLAWLSPDEARRIIARRRLEALTPHTLTEPARLIQQLEQVRRDGYATNRGETYVGVGSVAAPVRDRTGAVIAAISNGFPWGPGSPVDFKQLAGDVVSCADAVSRRLGETGGHGAAAQ